jgi:hypothetical protein
MSLAKRPPRVGLGTDPPLATVVRPIPLSSEAHPAMRENMKLEKIYPLI